MRQGWLRSSLVSTPDPLTRPLRPPRPLLVACAAVGLEALALLVVGVVELGVLSGSRLEMGLTTALFFLAYGVGLAFCAVRLLRLHTWARAPVVLTQLIQVMVAWSFRGQSTTWVWLVLVVVAVAVLAGVLAPVSTRALDEASAGPD